MYAYTNSYYDDDSGQCGGLCIGLISTGCIVFMIVIMSMIIWRRRLRRNRVILVRRGAVPNPRYVTTQPIFVSSGGHSCQPCSHHTTYTHQTPAYIIPLPTPSPHNTPTQPTVINPPPPYQPYNEPIQQSAPTNDNGAPEPSAPPSHDFVHSSADMTWNNDTSGGGGFSTNDTSGGGGGFSTYDS